MLWKAYTRITSAVTLQTNGTWQYRRWQFIAGFVIWLFQMHRTIISLQRENRLNFHCFGRTMCIVWWVYECLGILFSFGSTRQFFLNFQYKNKFNRNLRWSKACLFDFVLAMVHWRAEWKLSLSEVNTCQLQLRNETFEQKNFICWHRSVLCCVKEVVCHLYSQKIMKGSSKSMEIKWKRIEMSEWREKRGMSIV